MSKDGEGHIEKNDYNHTNGQLSRSLTLWGRCVISAFKKEPIPPPPGKIEAATVIPIRDAGIFSTLTYSWLSPLISLGYRRPLEVGDLWKMDPGRESGYLSELLNISWLQEQEEMTNMKRDVDAGVLQPPRLKRIVWSLRTMFRGQPEPEVPLQSWKQEQIEKQPSLVKVLFSVFGKRFWLAGFFKVVSDTSQITAPILVKSIINHAKTFNLATAPGKEIAQGVGMAFGLFLLTVSASVFQHQYYWTSMSTGVEARAALISCIHQRGMRLSPKSRIIHSPASLVNHLSTDIARIDYVAQWFHPLWAAPIQITICLIIMILQMGATTVVGFAVFFCVIPIQQWAMAYQFRQRRLSMKWTDKRAKLLQELLGSMRTVKYMCAEEYYLGQIARLRSQELKSIRRILVARSANLALAFTVPNLAAIVSIIVHVSITGKADPAVIFPVIALFNILRAPLLLLPRALSATADAKNALQRLSQVLNAEESEAPSTYIDKELDSAIKVTNAFFEWKSPIEDNLTNGSSPENEGQIFSLKDVNFDIKRGALCAIVGNVGSGKSSILSGLIGNMKRLSGTVQIGGTIAYTPQIAWIQNATLRDNILFGMEWEEEKYWAVIRACCLSKDLETLPNGDFTEIGEKGINLSGGQRQRVNIARALYYDAEIYLLDDPLSAVDTHVGRDIFQDAILGYLKSRGKTILLVTHAIHLLSDADQILLFRNGRIVENGTYGVLMNSSPYFAQFTQGTLLRIVQEAKMTDRPRDRTEAPVLDNNSHGQINRQIKEEQRITGSVSRKVYVHFFSAAKGWITIPLVLLAVLLAQTSQASSLYSLVWWQRNVFEWPMSRYMLLYGMLGFSQMLFTFAMGAALGWQSYLASKNLHHLVVMKLFHASISFFDTTPLGRLLGVLGKDIDGLDNNLPDVIRMFVQGIAALIGSVIVITIVFPYFIIGSLLVLVYGYYARYYQASARELKRLDSSLRSGLYSLFAESLSGSLVINAYNESDRFMKNIQHLIDMENRALVVTIANQRWLAVRLDFLGSVLVLCVALVSALRVNGLDASQSGIILTYIIQLTQLFGAVTRQAADVENNMNAVERVFQYTRNEVVPPEGRYQKNSNDVPEGWPKIGSVSFKEVTMSHRDDLPPILHSISFSIRGSEKIGIVGRTGSGKSSLVAALFRLRDVQSGRIVIDGLSIEALDLIALRAHITVIPQEPGFFQGTVRSNLDPSMLFDDEQLNYALRKVHLLDDPARNNIHLDTMLSSGGSNLSVGERALLSLARALLRKTRIVCLDEATASVDPDMDRLIQNIIREEFRKCTVLCIAHRLQTVLGYDRIFVMDSGHIAEKGSPLELFDNHEGIFHAMCIESGITRGQMVSAAGIRETDI
ncbi:ABC protein [Serendipita vermifera]|nr:ABC protein [Serendipita vermifera]